MTVIENVLIGLNARTPSTPFGLLIRALESQCADLDSTQQALEQMGTMALRELRDRRAAHLSSSQQRLGADDAGVAGANQSPAGTVTRTSLSA